MKKTMFILAVILLLILCITVKSEKKPVNSNSVMLEEVTCKPDSHMLPEVIIYGK